MLKQLRVLKHISNSYSYITLQQYSGWSLMSQSSSKGLSGSYTDIPVLSVLKGNLYGPSIQCQSGKTAYVSPNFAYYHHGITYHFALLVSCCQSQGRVLRHVIGLGMATWLGLFTHLINDHYESATEFDQSFLSLGRRSCLLSGILQFFTLQLCRIK